MCHARRCVRHRSRAEVRVSLARRKKMTTIEKQGDAVRLAMELRDQRDHVARLGFVDVLGGHDHGPAAGAQSMELFPDLGAQERVDLHVVKLADQVSQTQSGYA